MNSDSLLDAPGGFAAFRNMGGPEKIWTLEAVNAIFGLVGLREPFRLPNAI